MRRNHQLRGLSSDPRARLFLAEDPVEPFVLPTPPAQQKLWARQPMISTFYYYGFPYRRAERLSSNLYIENLGM